MVKCKNLNHGTASYFIFDHSLPFRTVLPKEVSSSMIGNRDALRRNGNANGLLAQKHGQERVAEPALGTGPSCIGPKLVRVVRGTWFAISILFIPAFDVLSIHDVKLDVIPASKVFSDNEVDPIFDIFSIHDSNPTIGGLSICVLDSAIDVLSIGVVIPINVCISVFLIVPANSILSIRIEVPAMDILAVCVLFFNDVVCALASTQLQEVNETR